MIYEFKSRATGSVVMTQDVAEALLKAIGKTPGAKGVITVEQMPEAITRLRDYHPSEENPAPAPGTQDPDADDDNQEEPVPLRVRAIPLIEMLEQAHKAGKEITWGV